jgi:predicted Zn-dependent peptidase
MLRMQKDIYTLDCGLRVILVNTGSFPSATVLLQVKTGSRFETIEEHGAAHFFEHMAFKGSRDFGSSLAIAKTIEGFGGMFNAFTSKDKTGYWIKTPLKNINTSLHVLADMVQNPLLLQEELEKERSVIIEEMNMYEDNPSSKVSDIYEQLIFAGNPLGRDIIGTKESLHGINAETLRNFITSHYGSNNAVLVIAGNIEVEKENIKKTIEEYFGSWKQSKKSDITSYKNDQVSLSKSIVTKKTEQAHIVIGYKTDGFLGEYYHALTLLSVILGGGMSSRLFSEIREKRGLCYYIGSSYETYIDTGTLSTQAGISVINENIKQALTAIVQEHVSIAENGVTDEELQRAKDLIQGRILLQMENSYSVASYVGSELLQKNSIEDIEVFLQKILSVKAETIMQCARRYFVKENCNIAFIGPDGSEVEAYT